MRSIRVIASRHPSALLGRCPVFLHYDRELLRFGLRQVRDHDATTDRMQQTYARILALKPTHAAMDAPLAPRLSVYVLFQVAIRLLILFAPALPDCSFNALNGPLIPWIVAQAIGADRTKSGNCRAIKNEISY